MFDFIKKKKLPQEEIMLYEWFNDKRKESNSHWKNVLKKEIKEDYFLRHKNAGGSNIWGRETGKDSFGVIRAKWEHELYGEIKDISDFWKNTNHLLKRITNAILNGKLFQEMKWINNKIQFIRRAIKEERKHVQKSMQEKPSEYGDEVIHHRSPTGEIVIKDKHYWARLDKLSKESDQVFLNVLGWSWLLLNEIERKLNQISQK